MDLKQLIREVLEDKSCCTATKPTKAPILNENLAPREILSEGLKYHIDNKKPLTEHVYRAGSENYFNLWAEARALYTRGILDFSGDDLAILTETQLGEFGYYEGKKVPLDFIMEEDERDLVVHNVEDQWHYGPFTKYGFTPIDTTQQGLVRKYKYENTKGDMGAGITGASSDRWEIIFADGKKEMGYWRDLEPTLAKYFSTSIKEINITSSGVMDLIRRVYKDAKLLDFLDFSNFKDFVEYIKTSDFNSFYEIRDEIEQYDKQLAEGQDIDEAKAKPKKKNPPIGKPMRGGSKKFYVYVKAPGGKIKKVSFGQAGMSAKINNPKARAAFAARHDCKNKKVKEEETDNV